MPHHNKANRDSSLERGGTREGQSARPGAKSCKEKLDINLLFSSGGKKVSEGFAGGELVSPRGKISVPSPGSNFGLV